MGALGAAGCCWRWRPSCTELPAHARAGEMQLIIKVSREELLGQIGLALLGHCSRMKEVTSLTQCTSLDTHVNRL